MSNYMPYEIQVQIIERLPVKCVIRCRTVSNSWRSLIDSSEFIARYRLRHSQSPLLLVRYEDPFEYEFKYFCFVDDHTFPQQKFTPTVPLFVEQLSDVRMIVSCQGLLCLFGSYQMENDSVHKAAVIWNPSIRKSVAVALPKFVSVKPFRTGLGFGVCPDTSDPKIIYMGKRTKLGNWQVKIFTLSSGSWRSLSSNQLRESIDIPVFDTVVIGKFIYWLASDLIAEHQTCNLIMSFDLANDEFREIPLPHSLALKYPFDLSIFKIHESFAVIEHDFGSTESYNVWMMEYGVPEESFGKRFSINLPDPSTLKSHVLEFRKTGKPILEVLDEFQIFYEPVLLAVFESNSEDIKDIGVYGTEFSYTVKSYTETLLLVNEPEFSSYLDIDEIEEDDD